MQFSLPQEAASTYNMPLIEQTMEIIGKDAVKEVTSMISEYFIIFQMTNSFFTVKVILRGIYYIIF